jgi:hypothetical protein
VVLLEKSFISQLLTQFLMKKIFYTLAASAMTLASLNEAVAQQRLVLFEEFTGENCGPCAAVNPSLNALLNSNATKVVAIKYQADIPSAGPLYNVNPAEVDARLSYYSVGFAPWGQLDGLDWTTGTNDNNVGNLNQAAIDTRANVASPFNMSVVHQFSSDADSVYISVNINPVSNFNSGAANSLKLRLALVEKEVRFDVPPGTNGEKDFFSVMRKMIPSPSGTNLADAWVAGTPQTINIGAPIPTYVADKSQIAIVAFIQDDNAGGTYAAKTVHQSAISTPISLPNDAAASTVSPLGSGGSVPGVVCLTTINPTVGIRNNGSSPLTNCSVEFYVNNVLQSTTPWNGNLAPGASGSVTIPPVTVTSGSNTLNAKCINPNNQADLNNGNDAKAFVLNVASAPTAAPITQDFEAAAFPPANWVVDNPDAGAGWTRRPVGASGSSASVRMYFFDSGAGEEDNLILPKVDMSSGGNRAKITFSHAHRQYPFQNGNSNDRVDLDVSINCGATWTTVWSKTGADLATVAAPASASNNSYQPVAADWVYDSVAINSLVGQSDVLVRFRGISDYGDNFFADNINVELFTVSSVGEIEGVSGMEVFPNPAAEQFTIKLDLDGSVSGKVLVANSVGQNVFENNIEELAGGSNFINVKSSEFAPGIYSVSLVSGSNTLTRKLVIK